MNELLTEARFIPSPNCDERPEHVEISLLVIHGISLPPGQFGSDDVIDFFCNRLDATKHDYYPTIAHLRVSIHLWVRRTGKCIQFVPFNKRAWHAGESSFLGVKACNDYSIGIELEGTDHIAYTEEQYQTLRHVTRHLMRTYPAITISRIVGHNQIAPLRKTDPGEAFNWHYYLKDLLS